MGWITPVTDHSPSDYFTHNDMNRIYGNLRYLYEILSPYFDIDPYIEAPAASEVVPFVTDGGVEIGISGGGTLGAEVTGTWWEQNDIYTIEDFQELIECLYAIARAISYQFGQEPTYNATADNFNVIESITADLLRYTNLVLAQFNGNHWVGDPFFVGDDIYTGGLYGT